MEKTLTSSISDSVGSCKFDVNDIFYQELLRDIKIAISTLPEGAYKLEFFSSIFEAFTAALAAFLINYLYWRRVEKKKNANKRLREIIRISEKLKKTASFYWTHDYYKQSVIQEIDIVDLHKKLVNLARNYRMEEEQESTLKNFNEAIYDVVTGGDFGSMNRKSDMKKVKKIADLCTSFQLTFDVF